jgi:hypothetical protein
MIDDVKLDLNIGGRPCRDGSTPDEIEIMKRRKGRGCLHYEPFQERVDIIGSGDPCLRVRQDEFDRQPRETIGLLTL